MKKNSLKLTALVLLTPLCLGVGVSAAIADSPATSPEEAFTLNFYPPNDGLPSDTTGGASRDSSACAVNPATREQSVTPLAPQEYLGLTVSARPEFFVQLDNTQAQRLFLSIQDMEGDYHYQAYQPLPSRDGLIELTLPDDAPDLEVGRTYRWSVALVCGQQLSPGAPTLISYVKRVDVTQNTDQLSPLERLTVYAESGIWYDTVALLNQERQSNESSDGLAEAWESLLIVGGLSDITP